MGDQRSPQKSPPGSCATVEMLYGAFTKHSRRKVHFMYDSVRGGDDRVHDELIAFSFRVPWPRKYHHARTLVGWCKGISASAFQRRAQEFVTQPCRKPSPASANPNPTSPRHNTSGRPRVGAGGVVPYPVTHKPCLVPMLGPGHA